MSRIIFNDYFSQGLMFSTEGNINSKYGMFEGTNGVLPPSKVTLKIYSGARPTSYATNYSAYAANLLIDFVASPTMTTEHGAGFTCVRLGIFTSAFTLASASGQASWFLLTRNDKAGDIMNWPAVIGSVGVTGSGSDLELPDVNIVSGNGYKCAGIRCVFPNTIDY